ncbi:MAG TPA: SRPBCC family protein [Blastocatellia bacterium]|nr:SRPBCC family protein [Blastocatellia bacterium]
MSHWTTLSNFRTSRKAKQHWADTIDLNSSLLVLGGIGIGLGLMYVFDPDRGRRRRALARDQFVHATKVLQRAAAKTARDVSHRSQGLWAEGSHLFRHEEVSDDALSARVRAALGRVVSHPHAIEVTAQNGQVRLEGHILKDEADALETCVAKVRGVRDVEYHLTIHPDATGIPSLQGGRQRSGNRSEWWQENWSPTTRLLAGVTGGGLMVSCLIRRDAISAALGTIGFGLGLRSVTNLSWKNLLGIGHDCRAIEVQKTININAPVDRVYNFWYNYHDFPYAMANVRAVKTQTDGRSEWTVAGPLRIPVKWTAEVTEQVPNELIAWQTAGSIIRNSGTIHFAPLAPDKTQVQIRMCYYPPGGALGHALAKVFRADPKTEMDADLVRIKTLIETGHAPHDAARPVLRAAALPHTRSAAGARV